MIRLFFIAFVFLAACGPVQFDSKSYVTTTSTPNTTSNVTTRDVHYTNTVTASSSKLDIVLVVDDSNSMLPDNQKLAAKLAPFISTLESSSIDWQMCVTVTRAQTVNSSPAWGASVYWQNYTPPSGTPSWVLKPQSGQDLSNIFASTINTIGAGWENSDDERAIKAAYWHVYNGDYHYSGASGCYRQDAALSYIIISDEDERSVGGDQSQVYYSSEANKPLENDDLPSTLVQSIKSTFGTDKRFTVNSIIVKPDDSACMATQDAGGSKSHYGVHYAELSNLTGGGVGSICDDDFSTNLTLFANQIQDSLSSIPLECTPVGSVAVTITPTMGDVTATVSGMSLIFSPTVPAGRSVDVQYKCAVQ